jgi:hypothetical protein
LSIIGGFIFGIFILLQHIGAIRIKSLNRLPLRWFFHPSGHGGGPAGHDNQGHPAVMDSWDEVEYFHQERGGGFPHAFAQDAIPLSMGGRLMNTNNGSNTSHPQAMKHYAEEPVCELELSEFSSPASVQSTSPHQRLQQPQHSFRSSPNGSIRSNSNGTVGDSSVDSSDQAVVAATLAARLSPTHHLVDGPPIPERLSRDPALVDLPDLRSTSKVAMPVSIMTSQQQHQQQHSRPNHHQSTLQQNDSHDSMHEVIPPNPIV